MWHDLVLKADILVERLTLGFVNTCSTHPLLSVAVLAFMLMLACTLWVQALEIGRTTERPTDPRPIRLIR